MQGLPYFLVRQKLFPFFHSVKKNRTKSNSLFILPAPPSDLVVPVRIPTGNDGGQVNAVVEGTKISLGNGVRSGESVAISSPSVTAIIGPGTPAPQI